MIVVLDFAGWLLLRADRSSLVIIRVVANPDKRKLLTVWCNKNALPTACDDKRWPGFRVEGRFAPNRGKKLMVKYAP
jgi:hypothetical protein